MFDKFEIMKYLLNKAFNNESVYYGEFYNYFEVESDDIPEFLDIMEVAEKRIIRDIFRQDDLLPIYTIILRKKVDNLPGIGFYDVFYNRNRELYKKIADDKTVQEIFKEKEYQDTKIKIFDEATRILNNDLKNRFPNQESVNNFLMEVSIYKDI